MKLIGYRRNNFQTQEGNTVTGYNLYLAYPATGDDAAGLVAERIYMTDDKLAKSGYVPHEGDEVEIAYNRYGKPSNIRAVRR